ncbi:MAG: cob(I)yrinic acid a,c-diamide adenosyltransferase [bacterium]
MIITYYGNGKGKTTAALGLVLRASGYGKKILFIQFIKSPKSITGEDKALKKIKNLTHKKFGLGFVGLFRDSHKISSHIQAAQKGLKYVFRNMGKFDIVVCDEILGAIKGGLIKVSEVEDLIKNFSKAKYLILTGRPKYKRLIDLSDLVSEVKEIKHPYRKGKLAIVGIDY